MPDPVAVPEITVVAPSHDRPLRLRWLLNALEDQTLAPERWEAIVGHDSSGPETEELLRTHPLTRRGTLRHITLPPGSGGPAVKRNAAWRIARAPLVLFTDDDCKPPPDWLQNALAAAARHPGAVIQGATLGDPAEQALELATYRHSRWIPEPPEPWAQGCNMLYPRPVLEAVGGWDETLLVGEDTDLCRRAIAAGVSYVGDAGMLTYHAIEEIGLRGMLRTRSRWRGIPDLVGRHPSLRAEFPLRVFWNRRQLWFPLALAGALLARRNPLLALLAVPWAVHAAPRYGPAPRARLRSVLELPAQAALDVADLAALARGSVEHRTLVI